LHLEKVKKGERNFVYLWMALLKSRYPKQSRKTCSAALGHDLTLRSAPKLSQPDISNGKKPRAGTEQRERECHASAHSSQSKNTLSDLWHNTDHDLWETQKILLPSRDTFFQKQRQMCSLMTQTALRLQAVRCIIT